MVLKVSGSDESRERAGDDHQRQMERASRNADAVPCRADPRGKETRRGRE